VSSAHWASGDTYLSRHRKEWFLNENGNSCKCEGTGEKLTCGEHLIYLPEKVTTKPEGPPYLRGARRGKVGSELKAIIKDKTGASPKLGPEGTSCACNDLAKKMDGWGVVGCSSRKGEIVSQMMASMKDLDIFDNVKPLFKIAAKLPLPEIVIRKVLDGWLDQAIEAVKAKDAALVKTRGRRSVYDPIAEASVPIDSFPFTSKPHATLLFHCYPTGAWTKHVDMMKKYAKGYDRKIMGIALGSNTASAEEVMEAFGDGWEYIKVQNDPSLREVATYRKMFDMVNTSDTSSVIVCAHGKCAQSHTVENPVTWWWTEAMYETVVGNLLGIIKAMEDGYTIAGSFRRFGRHFGCRYRYHFSGTFYAFRASKYFGLTPGKSPNLRSQWWGTESMPGDLIQAKDSYCLFGDKIGNLYNEKEQPREALNAWKEQNATVDPDKESL